MGVVLLCHHDEEGSFGLLLNRPTNLCIDSESFELVDQPELGSPHRVFMGGPVQTEALFFLYRSGGVYPESKEILPGVHLCSSPETLKILKREGLLDKNEVRFYLGYAGWSYFQLDCEASSDSWFVHPGKAEYIFGDPSHQLWLKVLTDIGEPFQKLGHEFIDHLKN